MNKRKQGLILAVLNRNYLNAREIYYLCVTKYKNRNSVKNSKAVSKLLNSSNDVETIIVYDKKLCQRTFKYRLRLIIESEHI